MIGNIIFYNFTAEYFMKYFEIKPTIVNPKIKVAKLTSF
ncbi:hypothetical protein C2W64_04605 [Brevibacillus laterosporus]|nr:hypothetical protein C2W64_04605 [Brevibacillus laterosporus]